MVNINNVFPSKYLRAADLNGQMVKVTIDKVVMETIGEDMKPVIYFKGAKKGLVANKTNGLTISNAFGPETDNWEGAEIELFVAPVPFNGKMQDAVRVRIPPRKPQARGGAWADGTPTAPGYDTGRTRVTSGVSNPPAPPAGEPLSDEVPF